MFLSRFFRLTRKQQYRLFLHGKETRQECPLPAVAPSLFDDKPYDRFCGLESLLLDAEDTIVATLALLHLEDPGLRKTITYNIKQILQIPAIYNLVAIMEKRGLKGLFITSHQIATLLQACLFRGQSEFSASLPCLLMPMLLGIYARHFGIPYLKPEEHEVLLQKRRFDLKKETEQVLREELLVRYKAAMEHLAWISADRFEQAMGKNRGSEEHRQVIADIILYSSRLMGRTAMELEGDSERGIQQTAAYIGVLHSLMSAQQATGKRLSLLLAEEYGRSRVHRKHQGLERTARYNHFALQDVMKACRCQVLAFFQGRDETVIYSEPENIYVRFMESSSSPAHWSCFESERPNPLLEKRENNPRGISQNVKLDPTDAELMPTLNLVDHERQHKVTAPSRSKQGPRVRIHNHPHLPLSLGASRQRNRICAISGVLSH